jgi:hypothetical protein
MKKLNKMAMIIVLASGLLTQSCKKQLEITPRNQLAADLVFTNKAGVEAAITSVYSVLKLERLYGRDLFSVPEAMADVAFANGRSSRLLNENRNTALANVTNWQPSYGAINEINLILQEIDKIGDASADDKARWEGELKFLRALYYFDLAKNYAYIPTYVPPGQDRGGVVLNLKGFNNQQDAIGYFPARASLTETYAQIMSDVYAAANLLSPGNRGRNFASKHAALALGSRVSMYEGRWARCDSFSSAALNLGSSGLGSLTNTGNYVQGWRVADHPESIFQVWYATLTENIGVNTSLAATHTTLSAPGASNAPRQGQGDLVPNAFLIGQIGITATNCNNTPFTFATLSTTPLTTCPVPALPTLNYSNDIRNRLFEWGVNAAGHYVEITKWLGKNGSPNWDNTVVFRWPELYLNRAEARFQMGQEDAAWADLNIIRTNRYVGFTAPTPRNLAGQALLNEILRQRMLEYAFEGYRFYDLKRYGLTINKSNPATNLPATDFRLLPRIPLGEVDGNPNMKQNFGY